MNKDFEFDNQNRLFWNEICGTTFAQLNKNNIIKKCEKILKYLVFKIIKPLKTLEFMSFLA